MSQKEVLRHLARFLRPVRGRFIASLVLLFIGALLTAAKAYLIQPVVDGFLAGSGSERDLLWLCGIVAGVFVTQAVVGYAYRLVSRMASARMINLMRRELFARLTIQSLAYFSVRPSADLLSRVVNDVSLFEAAAVGSLQALSRNTLVVILLIAVMVGMNPPVAAFCVVIVVATGAILRRMSSRLRSLGREVQVKVSELNRSLAELIGGMDLVLGFGLAESSRERFTEQSEDLYRTQLNSTHVSELAVMSVHCVVGLSIAAILGVTGYAMLQGTLSPGQFAAMIGALYLMQAPTMQIARSVGSVSRGLGAVSRALELLHHVPTVVDPDDPRPMGSDITVAFDKVSFHYRDDLPVLRNVSFTVAPGELLAIIGDSGAGKSTLAKLLMRFYDPAEGEVRIGEVALPETSREELYRRVSYVSQDIYLFDGTIEFNLRVGNPEASPAQLEEAIRIACVEDFLGEVPNGLETLVGERGMSLSGGQRQRIAIARAILSTARILIFDEATSALDMALEQRILRNLVHARQDRTIIAITHRLSIATVVDRIIVLKGGALVEEGDEAALDALDGEFARLKRAASEKLRRPTPVVGSYRDAAVSDAERDVG